MSAFRGFPPDLFAFFEGLERDNSKSYWNAHESVWENQIRTPMRALLDDLANEFGPMRMFRPNRDVRFSQDKSPYKLWVSATSQSRAIGGTGYYIEVSPTGLITGFGAMLMARDQLARFRAAWMHTPEALDMIRTVWRAAEPLKEWLDTSVGRSETPAR